MSEKEKIFSEVKLVEIEKLKPNEYNPNQMTEEQFNSLVEDIKENGLVGQPIIVNDKNEIIDGEHRFRAMKWLKYKKVPVVYFNPQNEEHQKILTIGWNSKRGEMSPAKLAGIIQELNQRHSLSELSQKLGYSQRELRDKLSINAITPEFMEKIKKEAEEREKEVPIAITFAVSKRQEKIVNEALEISIGKSKGDKLTYICSAYLEQEPKNEQEKEKKANSSSQFQR